MIGCCLSTPVDAAYKIARGDPPEWLVRALEIPFLGVDENYWPIHPEISQEEAGRLSSNVGEGFMEASSGVMIFGRLVGYIGMFVVAKISLRSMTGIR